MTVRSHFCIAIAWGVAACRSAAVKPTACPEMDESAGWALVSRAWSNEKGLRWSNDSLRGVLFSMRDRDQAARAEFGARVTDTAYVRRLIRLDSTITAELEVILERFGLPTRTMVGAAGSDAAMLIIQHSATLQERALTLAKAAPTGEISPEKLAMLEDRILVHQGKPQRFGTQLTLTPDGAFRLEPVVDAGNLDARRAAVGMPPMRAYLCMFEQEGMRVDRSSLPSMRLSP